MRLPSIILSMDFYSDSGHTFAKLFINYELPDYVKTANALDEDERKKIASTAFADPDARLFPILDPAQAFTSAAYAFAKLGSVSPDVVGRIRKAAKAFGIESDVAKLEEHVATLFTTPREVKVAEFENHKKSPFIIEFKTAGIDRVEGYGPEGVQKAAARFLSLWPRIDVSGRTKIAVSLLTAAEENEVSLDPEIHKLAGQAEIDSNVLRSQFNLRLGVISDSPTRTLLAETFNTKMAALGGAKTPADTKVAGLDIVTFLGDLDINHKVAKYYNERLMGPHQSVFNKVSSDPAELIVVGRHSFPGRTWHGDGAVFDQAINTILGPKKSAELKTAAGEYDPEKLAALADDEADLVKRLVG